MWGFLFSFARPPPLVCSFRFACLDYSPAPGRGMCERLSDLRLRAWRRSACLLPCRAALSLPLVRYCRTVRPAWRVACSFRLLSRRPVPHLLAGVAILRPACLVGWRPAPFPASPSRHPARRTGSGWRGVAACLSVHIIGTVAVSSCGRAVFYFSVGFAAVVCAASWIKRRGCR